MSKVIDLTNRKVGKLTVIKRVENSKLGQARWLCKCDCGGEKIIQSTHLVQESIKSCGCILKNGVHRTHEKSRTRLYRIYRNMKSRCYNPNASQYHRYGGRGISMCDEWNNDFMTFYNWSVSNGYSDELQVDRINNDGSYEPNNCKWATMKEQSFNKSNTKIIFYNGKQITVPELSELLNVSTFALYKRIRKGEYCDINK